MSGQARLPGTHGGLSAAIGSNGGAGYAELQGRRCTVRLQCSKRTVLSVWSVTAPRRCSQGMPRMAPMPLRGRILKPEASRLGDRPSRSEVRGPRGLRVAARHPWRGTRRARRRHTGRRPPRWKVGTIRGQDAKDRGHKVPRKSVNSEGFASADGPEVGDLGSEGGEERRKSRRSGKFISIQRFLERR